MINMKRREAGFRSCVVKPVYKVMNGDAFGHYVQTEKGLERLDNTKQLSNWYGDMPKVIPFSLMRGFYWGNFIGGFDYIGRAE